MNQNSLSEQLQSLLRSRALDAPLPNDSVRAVFERVGLPSEADTPVEIEPSGSDEVAAPVSPPVSPPVSLGDYRSRRWPPSGRQFLLAAVIALVVVGAGVGNALRTSGDRSERAATSAASAAGDRSTDKAAGALAPNLVPSAASAQPSPNSRAEAALMQRFPADLDCVGANTSRVTSNPTVIKPKQTSFAVAVVVFRCNRDPVAGIGPSDEVQAFRWETDGPVGSGTVLVPASYGFQLDYVVAADTEVVMQYAELGQRPQHGTLGALYQARYVPSPNAAGWSVINVVEVAAPCISSDVSVTTAQQSGAAVGSASGAVGLLVRVTNKMSAPCSLIGYPGLETDDAPAKSKLTRALRDASFGTTNATPPIIVLAPGGSATAGVEWALSSVPPAAASCAGSARFSLPNGSVVQPVPVPLACTPVTVYPFISGFSGKD